MNRREVVAGIIGAAAWPLKVQAQGNSVYRVGILAVARTSPSTHLAIQAFRDRLTALGFTEGKNLHVKIAWAEEGPEAAVRELLNSGVEVLVHEGAEAILKAAAISTAENKIPVVMSANNFDPVETVT